MPKGGRLALAPKGDTRIAGDERARRAVAAAAANAIRDAERAQSEPRGRHEKKDAIGSPGIAPAEGAAGNRDDALAKDATGGAGKTGAAEKTGAPEGKAASGDAAPAETRDTIRIVIRDAKPPVPARALQAFTRTVCALLLVCVAIIGVPRLFGVYEFNVLTGSMTPTYPVGTLVFVQPKEPTAIRPGEVASYVMDEELNIVTHRVVDNDYDAKTITTKGDANASNDAPVLYQNIVGVVVFAIPYVGGVVDYLVNDERGRIFGVGLLVAVLAATFLAEGICSAMTRHAANVIAPGGKRREDGELEVKSYRNTRKARKELERQSR